MPSKLYAIVHVGGWIPLKDQLPKGKESVLLFSPYMYLDREFPGHPVSVSNPDFVRQNATKKGYTHWCSIPYPLPPVDISVITDWSDWEWRYYWTEEDEPPEIPRRTMKQRLRRFVMGIAWAIGK